MGLGFVVLGMMFLLSQLGVGGFRGLIATWWPMLLIIAAVGNLVSSGGRSFGALILLVIGIALQLDHLGWFEGNVWSLAWPVLIVVIGVRLLVEPRWHHHPGSRHVMSASRSTATGERIDITSIMAGRNEQVVSRAWTGGEVTAVMGGAELHLNDAVPVPGGAHLRATAVMGGIDLYVPRHWDVAIHGTPLLGGIDDKRQPEPPADDRPRPRLVLDASAVLGGIVLKDA